MITALKASFDSKAAQDTVRELEVGSGRALRPGSGNRDVKVMSFFSKCGSGGVADSYGVFFPSTYIIYHNFTTCFITSTCFAGRLGGCIASSKQ